MKKIVLAFALVFAVSSMAVAVDTTFFGYNWLRYEVNYSNADLVSSSGKVARTYFGWKLKVDDELSGTILLDIAQVDNAQSGIDWGIWAKLMQIDYKLMDDLSVRAGVQIIPFGMNDLWKYPLIATALEVKKGKNKVCDLGLSVNGKITGIIDYQIYTMSGGGYKSIESDFAKTLGGSIGITPIEGLLIRASYLADMILESKESFADSSDTSFVIRYKNGDLDSYAQYLVSTKNESGTSEGASFFAGYQILDFMDINLRYDIWNPDTTVQDDDIATYIIGTNIKIKDNLSVALNYENSQPTQADTGIATENIWSVQSKFSY